MFLNDTKMTEYLILRASEILDQGELVAFLESNFPRTRPIGKDFTKGARTVEIRVPAASPEFREIERFIASKREGNEKAFQHFPIASYLRKYSKTELAQAEVLPLTIASHFEPSGEECGTIYETLCHHCNWGRQVSDLILDLRKVPQHKDLSETIAWVEWIVSAKFVRTFVQNKLTGAKFNPVFDLRIPTKKSREWSQLCITGRAGPLAETTKLGKDPFSPSHLGWRCPLGHSVVTQFLSEIDLHKNAWDGSDIAITTSLFGQGRNLLRPAPLIIISQRAYRAFQEAGLKGFSYEVAHLV
jgi:hypothetical protein